MNILITGLPQSGKTTLLKSLLKNHPQKTGFFTHEIRENGTRTGFEIETSRWEKVLFASTTLDTPHNIGKYGVDISALERILPSLSAFQSYDILFIDEIGPMELISPFFRNFCMNYLDAPNFCVALSQVYVNDFTEAIKKRSDTMVFEITPENREIEMDKIACMIHSRTDSG